MDDHAEISIIEPSEQKNAAKSPEKMPKPKTPRSKAKPMSSAKKMAEIIEPSPSVLTKKKKPSPKSNRKKITTPATDSSTNASRPQRSVQKKKIVYSDDESDKENESDWSDDGSYSDSMHDASDILTDDDSGKENGKSKTNARKPTSVRGKNAAASSTSKRSTKKANKNDLIYLDLSSEEIAQVGKNHHANVSEEDLANITRKFLETDLNDKE